nr:hypothetical protein [Tanacetum cinerariifolium]
SGGGGADQGDGPVARPRGLERVHDRAAAPSGARHARRADRLGDAGGRRSGVIGRGTGAQAGAVR